jgi:uncharacterized protein (DUF58 family)
VHLAHRSYVLVVLTAVLAVSGIWSSDAYLAHLWHIPAALLLLGLALEGVFVRRMLPQVHLRTAARAFLGRSQPAAFVFTNPARRAIALEYAPATPVGFEPLPAVRRISIPSRGVLEDALTLTPVRLGPQRWPALPARLRGALGLAWWTSVLQPPETLTIAPEVLRERVRARGFASGVRVRRALGAGQELHQLRSYAPGDPLTRIDWKATARSGALVTREYSEDQHLDVLVAIDAGRLSRVRSGRLDRFGLYCNVAASFAELVTFNDDRIGLLVYADQVLASRAPARGLAAVVALRRALEQLVVLPAESDPTVAAVSIRRLLRQRALIVVLTDLDDASVAGALARAVRLLAPPHLVLIAGVHSGEIEGLATAEARDGQDPWIALAATEQLRRAAAQRELLQRLGAPLVSAAPQQLAPALISRYETLRQARRV